MISIALDFHEIFAPDHLAYHFFSRHCWHCGSKWRRVVSEWLWNFIWTSISSIAIKLLTFLDFEEKEREGKNRIRGSLWMVEVTWTSTEFPFLLVNKQELLGAFPVCISILTSAWTCRSHNHRRTCIGRRSFWWYFDGRILCILRKSV